MTRPLVEVADLEVRTTSEPSYAIVTGISFSLGPSEVLGIVGESGSGKTTTALSLLGYARAGTKISGSVKVEGTELIATSESERRRARGHLVSYVPQDPSSSLNPALRIGLQLEETMAATRRERRNLDHSRISELLEKVRLPTTNEFLRRYPHQLSGGQLQRVCIAMAMVNRPRLIVFDEPTTGLDVTTQGSVLETIRELIAGEQSAAVYVTHDLAVISDIANRVAVMYAGVVVEESTTATVLGASAHPYAKRLVLATPSVEQRRQLIGITGAPLNPRDRSASCPFAPRCEYVEQACLDELPPFNAIDPGHRVRCVNAEQVRTSSTSTTSAGPRTWEESESTDTKRLLVLAGMYASYGEHEVLHEIEASIGEGECMALVGESGSGKTTLARCVSGIHPGRVEGYLGFDGSALPWTSKERTPESRRQIQYVFQNPYASLNPRLTVGKIIAQPLANFGLVDSPKASQARVLELLDQVALPSNYERRYPSQLSGGERQRVAIARALAADPRLLVCDEVTSALDVSIQASILELLGQLRLQTNLTILFITHNLGIVRAIADHVVILQGGIVVERGPAGTVLDAPENPYTRELLSNTPVLSAVGPGA
jgi:peptide/nickel transport system ATP-binding protein